MIRPGAIIAGRPTAIWHFPTYMIPVLAFWIAGLGVNLALAPGEELFWFNPYRIEPLNSFFKWATRLGEYPVFIAFGVPVLLLRPRAGIFLLLTGLLISPVSYISKDQIAKDRPITWVRDGGRIGELVVVPGETLNGGQTSFPSGHTMAAFGMFSALTVLFGKSRPGLGFIFAFLSILTAISRMFLVQHFLSDVIGGSLVGLMIAELARVVVYAPAFEKYRALDEPIIKRGD